MQAGWNLGRCQSCGVNVLTDTNASDGLGTSVDQCYIAPGWGASFSTDTQQLMAFKCNNGSYGVAERTYGVDSRPCKVGVSACFGGNLVLYFKYPGWHYIRSTLIDTHLTVKHDRVCSACVPLLLSLLPCSHALPTL